MITNSIRSTLQSQFPRFYSKICILIFLGIILFFGSTSFIASALDVSEIAGGDNCDLCLAMCELDAVDSQGNIISYGKSHEECLKECAGYCNPSSTTPTSPTSTPVQAETKRLDYRVPYSGNYFKVGDLFEITVEVWEVHATSNEWLPGALVKVEYYHRETGETVVRSGMTDSDGSYYDSFIWPDSWAGAVSITVKVTKSGYTPTRSPINWIATIVSSGTQLPPGATGTQTLIYSSGSVDRKSVV